ncbi:nucleotidyltransferase family protein [Peribacillus simplex]|uniref:nucleotidyltransferase domain-containing protein n=1 Tax=Peribacillus simplex TaxID=1478 RepID=UPI0010BEE0B4|nr:nucleotidyltransferase family protein [Peribacillus simplex]TKH00649.1 nucleotidyltransferase family protein [Peribacillus simplex]
MDKNFNLDLSTIPKELKLLLEIIQMEVDTNIVALKKELFTEVNWEHLLQLARYHRVYPIVYKKLNKLDKKWIPPHVIQTLYQEYQENTYQMLQLSGEMELLSKLFTENQIHLLFLKGPVIAADLYGDISLRTSKDLDMLIPINKLEKAEELLLNFGYEREETTSVLNELKWRNHHVTYFHRIKNIELEIHWRMQPRPSKEPCFNELWEQKRISPISSYPVYFLGKEDLFLYLVCHGARHGWFRLRWLLDIDKMVRNGLDFEKANTILKKYRSSHLGGQALILASQLLKTPIKEEMKILTVGNRSKNLSQRAIFFIKGLEPLHNITSTNYYRRYLVSLKTSNFHKISHLVLLFYPSSIDAKTLRLPKPLHFLYFPLRPFLSLWRMARKTP